VFAYHIHTCILFHCYPVLRDLDQHICDDDEKRAAKLRTRAIQEICVSETNYIHQLDKLITVGLV
jgi:hypothetical protein